MSVSKAPFLIKRLLSTVHQSRNGIQHLKERSLIELKGPDVSDFLQGLITNDINHLSDNVGCIFSVFLNTKGRILFDTLIYKTENKDVYWIECDSNSSTTLQKHLKMYKVHRKIDISSLDDYQIYALFNIENIGHQNGVLQALSGEFDINSLPKSSTELKAFQDLLVFKDPRAVPLGFRIISKKATNIKDSLKSVVQCSDSSDYQKLRYSLGVGEGVMDLLFGSSFPLECNCDYLHGVSFHKGCYIGQEVTARTHHTGVIRKRLMPLFFCTVPTKLPENGIILHNKINLGKLRGVDGNVGLALLRISQALEFGSITVGNGEARVIRPFWWPVELPKEKLNVQSPT